MKKTRIIQLFCVALAICMILCGLTACSGKAITLTVKALGVASYQWQFSNDNGVNWHNTSATGIEET